MEGTRARNERLAREYLDGELLAARDFLEAKLAHLFPGLLGVLLNPLAKNLYHAIGEAEVRKRIHRQLDVLAQAAREADERGVDAAVALWEAKYLETEEIVHRGNRHHPRFAEVEARMRETFRRKLDALRPLFAVASDAASYAELARAAYPERAAAEAHVKGDIRNSMDLAALVRKDPDLLRFPRPLVRPMLDVLDDVLAWYERRAATELDRIYGQP